MERMLDTRALKDVQTERGGFRRDEGVSLETWLSLLKERGCQCEICGKSDMQGEDGLEPHVIIPGSKEEIRDGNNVAVTCSECHETVHEVADGPPRSNDRLTKAQKRRLWEKRGMVCERCGFSGGGGHIAVHPFKPAGWQGDMRSVRILCATCLGEAASKRDRIEKLAGILRKQRG